MGNFLAGMAATLCVAVALVAGYVAGGGEFGRGSGGGEEASGAQPELRATVLNVRPTATPEPPGQLEPTPPTQAATLPEEPVEPDRTSCDEIYGTQFRSETEREFFFANCVPESQGGEAASEDTAAAPAQPQQAEQAAPSRFTWGGSGGEYMAFSTTLCASGTVGYTVSGEYSGRSFCTQEGVPGVPPFTCPEGAHVEIQEATAGGAVIGEVFCIIPNGGGGN